MKKIMVMSDTHGNKSNIAKALTTFTDVDAIIHLGDYVRDAEYINKLSGIKVYAIKGNCDISSKCKGERIINIDGKKILAVHGHQQGVKSSLLRLALYAQEKEVDAALFGHTHIPTEKVSDGVLIYNPGSLGEPRGRKPSVGIITIEDNRLNIETRTI